MKERDFTIDIMRTIGILLIILAHMNLSSSDIIFQIRTFDVPMMILISGASFFIAGKTSEKYLPYVWSRIKRLVFPVWFFLFIFYVATYFFKIESTYSYLNYKIILSSFALYSGFGYVWIIRVFLLVAILSPIYVNLIKYFGPLKTILAFQITCLLLTVLFLNGLLQSSLPVNLFFNEILIPSISYGLMFSIGYSLKLLSTTSKIFIFIANLALVILSCFIYTNGFHINEYKYPPTMIYISYAITISLILHSLLSLIDYKNKFIELFVKNIAPNTIWIYLWHIPMIFVIKNFFSDYNYLINLIITATFSVSMAIIQRRLVGEITKKIKNKNLSKFITQIFTG